LKRAVTNLSKPENNPGLNQNKLNQLRRIADKAGVKIRIDIEGVKGTGVSPHGHVEGLGRSIEKRHIWLQGGIE